MHPVLRVIAVLAASLPRNIPHATLRHPALRCNLHTALRVVRCDGATCPAHTLQAFTMTFLAEWGDKSQAQPVEYPSTQVPCRVAKYPLGTFAMRAAAMDRVPFRRRPSVLAAYPVRPPSLPPSLRSLGSDEYSRVPLGTRRIVDIVLYCCPVRRCVAPCCNMLCCTVLQHAVLHRAAT